MTMIKNHASKQRRDKINQNVVCLFLVNAGGAAYNGS